MLANVIVKVLQDLYNVVLLTGNRVSACHSSGVDKCIGGIVASAPDPS